MDRANDFIALFNQVSEHLRDMLGVDTSVPFSQLVDRAGQNSFVVQRMAPALKDYGDLRNAIVHHRDYPNVIIAEPTETALTRFQGLADQLISPRHLIPTFQSDVKTFPTQARLADALKLMSDNDYSQVVVLDGSRISLLTSEGIARWLGKQVSEDIISVAQATIGDVLSYDTPDSFTIMSRSRTVHDAQEAFQNAIEHKRPRLFAIVITQNGKATEKPLGIVTPWDLLEEEGQ